MGLRVTHHDVNHLALIQIGLDVDAENVDLWEQYGGFAFSAALEAEQNAALDAQNGGGVSPEALNDILAFVLQRNDFPAGSAELALDPAAEGDPIAIE